MIQMQTLITVVLAGLVAAGMSNWSHAVGTQERLVG